ncbi:MAG: DUF2066 domain-containing protein [Rhodospirillales bacterium]|nr:DUF2066 domain-containing protein [Rhodospirillales bacterium]
MKLVYKPFLAVLIVLAAGLALSGRARAQTDATFTIEGVHADASAESATKAREAAFGQAQSAAFAMLAGRLLSPTDLLRFKTPDITAIGPMIQDFEIVNERISPVRYIGTYTFRFDPASVRTFLGGQGFAISESSGYTATSVLVLPFFQSGNETILWGGNNPWRAAWERMQGAASSVLVPLGDLQDVQDMPDDRALTYDRAALDAMLARYGAAQAIIAIARPLPDSAGGGSGGLEIYLYRSGTGGPAYLETVTVSALPDADIYGQAVRQVSDVLRDLSRAENGTPRTRGQTLTLYLTFSGSEEWMETRKALESLPGLSDLGIESLTPRAATLSAAFSGDGPRFLTLAQAQGLAVTATPTPDAYEVCLTTHCGPRMEIP